MIWKTVFASMIFGIVIGYLFSSTNKESVGEKIKRQVIASQNEVKNIKHNLTSPAPDFDGCLRESEREFARVYSMASSILRKDGPYAAYEFVKGSNTLLRDAVFEKLIPELLHSNSDQILSILYSEAEDRFTYCCLEKIMSPALDSNYEAVANMVNREDTKISSVSTMRILLNSDNGLNLALINLDNLNNDSDVLAFVPTLAEKLFARNKEDAFKWANSLPGREAKRLALNVLNSKSIEIRK